MDESIDKALEALLQQRGSVSSGELSARTGLTRQALHAHLRRWVAQGRLVRTGRGRATRYQATGRDVFERCYPLEGLLEDEVWHEARAWLEDLGAQRTTAAERVLHAVMTALVNNAIDHSRASQVTLRVELLGTRCRVEVRDEGIGAFENVRSKLGFEDHLDALQQLSKGKLTTAPEHHTGEGLFFSSKLVELFELHADGYAWVVDRRRADQAVLESTRKTGTRVRFEIDLRSELEPMAIFEQYTSDFEFDKTRCVVRLFEYGVHFVSRSEAKRLVQGLERFRHVILDFARVEGVGQGFVDEVFRVWACANPGIRLEPVNMAPAVRFMVRRGLRA